MYNLLSPECGVQIEVALLQRLDKGGEGRGLAVVFDGRPRHTCCYAKTVIGEGIEAPPQVSVPSRATSINACCLGDEPETGEEKRARSDVPAY